MKTSELLARITEATGQTPALAADHLDKLASLLLRKLRCGKKVKVPGLGVIRPSGEEFP